MTNKEFNELYTKASSTNILNNEFYNQEAHTWLFLTTKQHIKMYKLMIKQGAKEYNVNGRKYIKLENGIQINKLY